MFGSLRRALTVRPASDVRSAGRTGFWKERKGRSLLPSAAAVLAGMVLALAVCAGPHLLEHLRGAGTDGDHCAICAAIQGVRTTSLAAPPPPVSALPVAGALAAIPAPVCLLRALSFSSSRAPPALP